jgi:hypothetical protein
LLVVLRDVITGGDHKSRNRAFHIYRSPAKETAIFDDPTKGIMAPILGIAGRNNIGMPGKTEMRITTAIDRKEIVDAIGFLAKRQAMTGKTKGG